jgi:ATP-dependent Clp protease ATP-binding subunit ClpA
MYAPYERARTDKKLHSVLANNPYNSHNLSIILIDEAEKAHPEILTAFLGAIQN